MTQLRLRHARHYADYGADDFRRNLNRHGGVDRLRLMCLERDNLVGGVDATLDLGQMNVAARCALGAHEVFMMEGPYSEGAILIERCLA